MDYTKSVEGNNWEWRMDFMYHLFVFFVGGKQSPCEKQMREDVLIVMSRHFMPSVCARRCVCFLSDHGCMS